MKRHKWSKVDKDLRRYIDEPRPLIHLCETCGLYRMTFNFGDKEYPLWKTFYGEPYRAGRQRPDCK